MAGLHLFEFYVLCIVLSFTTAEPISSFVSVAAGTIASVGFATWSYTKCYYNECCNDEWVHFSPTDLETYLKKELFGQHLVSLIIPRTLQGFIEKKNPQKALVMSFHGPTGTGKNHVSKMIARSIYKSGSKYIHLYIANRDFPHRSETAKYQNRIRKEIQEYTKLCGRSLFIFDEVDKMPPGVLDALKPYLDYHEEIDSVDYRKNIFIFLSNDGGHKIMEVALKFWSDGREREEITMKNIEPLISKGVFNEKGGLQFSEIIRGQLIDAYIPFLPLEKKHVKECIISELKSRNLTESSVSESDINIIANELEYVPERPELFSVSGCKRIPQKVDTFLI